MKPMEKKKQRIYLYASASDAKKVIMCKTRNSEWKSVRERGREKGDVDMRAILSDKVTKLLLIKLDQNPMLCGMLIQI